MINKDLETYNNDYITNFGTLITIINNYTEERRNFNSIVENITIFIYSKSKYY